MAIDGKSLLYALRENLNESSTSTFMDNRTSYRFLHEAAMAFVSRTQCITAEQTIITTANGQGYTLNADFMRLYLKNSGSAFYIKYSDGTNTTFPTFKDYEDIIYENLTTAVSVPGNFSIIDDTTKDTQLSSTTTSAGASSGGQCTLTDTASDFADVSAGDMVHNTTDGSDGVVLSKTSSTVLVTALFGGTDNDWTSGDSFVIQPQARMKLYFNQPTSTASHTITVPYVKRPDPVYSDYGIYRILMEHLDTLVEYATARYKMRDAEPGFAQDFYQYWDRKVRASASDLNQTLVRKRFTVNFKVNR